MNKICASKFSTVQSKGDSTFYTRIGKRIFDILFALILLPVVVPIILVLAFLVKLDGGPVFFGHKRIGMGGCEYKCWKLRSMCENAELKLIELCNDNPELAAEWEKYQKLEDDPRISKVGSLLRATRLDELPQIWNVLIGQMSFVGPRPFTSEQTDIYINQGGKNYFCMRPGITGLWQVRNHALSEFTERVIFDEAYSEKRCFKTDVIVILQTLKIILRFNGK